MHTIFRFDWISSMEGFKAREDNCILTVGPKKSVKIQIFFLIKICSRELDY